MRNIDLYSTPAEADKAFHKFCNATTCIYCPHNDPKEPDCKFKWAMAKADTVYRADLYETPEAAINDFDEICHSVNNECTACKYNIANGGREVCMAAWLMERIPK